MQVRRDYDASPFSHWRHVVPKLAAAAAAAAAADAGLGAASTAVREDDPRGRALERLYGAGSSSGPSGGVGWLR